MVSNDDLLAFLKKQITVENEIVNSLNEGLAAVQNQAVRGVLKGISLDSVKHAELYASAIKLLTGVPTAMTEKNLDKQRALVERHIQLELELIKKIGEVVPDIENDKVRLLLNGILADEKRHHELLKQVLEILVRGETITEEEWFDVMWKSVPFHGSPGG